MTYGGINRLMLAISFLRVMQKSALEENTYLQILRKLLYYSGFTGRSLAQRCILFTGCILVKPWAILCLVFLCT